MLPKSVTKADLLVLKKIVIKDLEKIQHKVNLLPDKSFLIEQYSIKSHKHPEAVHKHEELAKKDHRHEDMAAKIYVDAKFKTLFKRIKKIKDNQRSKVTVGQAFLFTVGLAFLFMGLSGISIHRASTVIGIIIFIASFLV
ncbi:hypothetical protein LCGC14_2913580 [marine sediment metagenome]|uniref:DUF2335 domain-containing protein n=1 Tax=marine sediment metagenome TaxID=412755 RepID=A0A0F9AH42_9ZZZZ